MYRLCTFLYQVNTRNSSIIYYRQRFHDYYSATSTMSPSWITVNKKLLKGSSLINRTSNEVFQRALTCAITQDAITEQDLLKLNESMLFNEEELQYWIQSIIHILNKSRAIVTKPVNLQKDLESHLKLNTDKAECFVNVWTAETKKQFGDLDKRKKLDDVAWALNLRLQLSHHPPGSKCLETAARMQFSLSDLSGQNEERHDLDLQFADLKELYSTLEEIQESIDSSNARITQ